MQELIFPLNAIHRVFGELLKQVFEFLLLTFLKGLSRKVNEIKYLINTVIIIPVNTICVFQISIFTLKTSF